MTWTFFFNFISRSTTRTLSKLIYIQTVYNIHKTDKTSYCRFEKSNLRAEIKLVYEKALHSISSLSPPLSLLSRGWSILWDDASRTRVDYGSIQQHRRHTQHLYSLQCYTQTGVNEAFVLYLFLLPGKEVENFLSILLNIGLL